MCDVANFESRRSHGKYCEFRGVYEVWREVRGEGAGILKWRFCGKVEAVADGKARDELCGIEPYSLIRCQWSKRPLPP